MFQAQIKMAWFSRSGGRQLRILSFVSVCIGAVYFYFSSSDDNNSLQKQKGEVSAKTGSLIKRYCNYPLSSTESGLSAQRLAESGLKLRGLSVVTRHGDRAPLTKFADHLKVPFCGLTSEEDIDLYNSYAESITSSKQQEVLPPKLSRLRKYPPTDECQPGHLTVLGVVQMLKLGRHLRSIYADVWPFDPKHTNFYVYSTTFSRTYQSCWAFVSGFLGRDVSQLNLQASEETHFCTETWCACPNMAKLNEHFYSFQESYFESIENRKNREIVEVMKDVLKNASGDALACYDHVMAYACHKAEMPCLPWINDGAVRTCIDDHMMEKLGLYLHKSYAELYKVKWTMQKSLIEAMPVFAGWRKLLKGLQSSGETNGFMYFSGHDVTLVPLLAVLGVFDGHIPPYAANLRVEIFERAKGEYYFRFVYNNEDVTKNVAFCQRQNLEHYGDLDLCRSQAVTDFIQYYLDEKSTPTEQFKKICN